MKNPEIITIQDNIFLIDRDEGMIEIFNAQGETIKRFSVKEHIVDIKTDINKNYLAIHLQEVGDIEEVVFYDAQGENKGGTGKIKNGKIIDYNFNKEEDKIVISAIEYDKNLKNNVMIMNMKQKVESGKILKNEIVLKTFIGKDQDIIYATLDKIYVYGKDNKLKWERKIKIDKIDYSYNLDLIILCKESVDKTQVTLIDRNNTIIYEGSINGKITRIMSNNQGALLYGQRTIGIIHKSGLEEIKFNKDILWAYKINERNIIIGNNKYIEYIKILSSEPL